MNRVLGLYGLLSLIFCTPLCMFAATTPLFNDTFTVSANSTNVSFEAGPGRQSGSRAPLQYTELDRGQDNYSQLNRPSFEGQLFMAASGSANLVMVSPNSNFNATPGTNGVFYIEFDVNPVLNSVANTNPTASAWAAIKFGSLGQNKTVNDSDGFGILFRGEANRDYQAFDNGTNVLGGNYTPITTDTSRAIRIELRRVTAGAALFDGSPVEIKCFVDGAASPIFTFVRATGFTSNFISLIAETEGSGGDGISRHTFDNLRVTSAPAVTVALSLPGGNRIDPNTAFATTVIETGVTQKIEYYVGATKVGQDITPADGFTFNYAGLASGTYSLTAVATDLFGATATSAPVNILVTNRPTVALTAPTDGALYTSGTPFQISATASDSDGTVAKVEFFQDGTKIGEDTNGVDGYTFSFPGVATGSVVLSAVATDNVGATSLTAVATVLVTAPPTVTLLSPGSAMVVDEPASLALDARAIDPDGFIAKVEFYANALKIGEDTNAFGGFTASVASLPPGVYALTAVATDSVGFVVTSAPVSFTVRALPRFDSIGVTPTTALTGQTISGTAAASGATLAWNWGDGSSSTGSSVSHVYAVPGAYAVTVTATSSAGATSTQTLSVFIGQDLFGDGGAGVGSDGVTGVLVGGDGVGPASGASVTVKADFVHRTRTSMRGVLNFIKFPSGLTQDQLANQSSSLHLGSGDAVIPFSFSLGSKGRGKATAVKKIELNIAKRSFSFHITGQALTDLLESLGATRESAGATVRVPATLQVGTQFFLVLTFELEFTAKGTKGTGGLAK